MPAGASTGFARNFHHGARGVCGHGFNFGGAVGAQPFSRSNVESTFSMMKRKFGDGLQSKTDVAMVNKTLCKILCHKLVVLIHETCEHVIDPVFWPDNAASV